MDDCDPKIIDYVTGAVVHSIISRRSCDSCRMIMLKDIEKHETYPMFDIEGLITPDIEEFLNRMNRGKLCVPSYSICN